MNSDCRILSQDHVMRQSIFTLWESAVRDCPRKTEHTYAKVGALGK